MSSKMGSHMIKAGKDCMEVPGIFTLCQHYGLRPSLLTWWEKDSAATAADQVAISPSFMATLPPWLPLWTTTDVCFTIPTTSLWSLDTISQQTRMMEKKQSMLLDLGKAIIFAAAGVYWMCSTERSCHEGVAVGHWFLVHGAGGFYKI